MNKPNKELKERPILFNTPMVKALLDGRKTQTRRVVKPCPSENWTPYGDFVELHGLTRGELDPDKIIGFGPCNEEGDEGYCCKFGQRGDRLWVREEHYKFGHWVPNPVVSRRGRKKWLFVADSQTILYDSPEEFRIRRDYSGKSHWYKRHARFMPRWASRLTLEITDIRVERLRDISEADAQAEGIFLHHSAWTHDANIPCLSNPIAAYRRLWEAIFGAGSWDENPWVWVIGFERVTP